jgi:hypothetical protein
VPKNVSSHVLARIETGLLNELMRTTGRADNVISSGDTLVSRITSSARYFREPQSANCAGWFPRFPIRKFRSGFVKTCNYSFNLILCRDVTRALPMLLNGPISIYDVFYMRICRYCRNLMSVPSFRLDSTGTGQQELVDLDRSNKTDRI